MSGSEETITSLPGANAAFLTDLNNFLQREDAERFDLQLTPFVQAGGTHATGAGLTGAPTALVAFPGGFYTTESGSITYADASTTWVICHKDLTGDQGVFTRVSGTHYLIFVGENQPTLPADSLFLMKTTTSGGAITAVEDLRTTSATGLQADFDNHAAATGVITPTGTPTLAQVAGGSQGARTYYVKFTYVNAVGETLVSAEDSLAVSSNNVLQVTSPGASGDATGYNVYVDTISDANTKQNTSVVTIGASWIEPSSGLISGDAVPSANTTFPHVQGVKIDTPTIVGVLTALSHIDLTGDLRDVNSNEWLALLTVASAVNHLSLRNAAAGNNPLLQALGGDTDVSWDRQVKGDGLHRWLDGNGNEILEMLAGIASAVNYTALRNASTGTKPGFFVLGDDTDVGMLHQVKGDGVFQWLDGNGNEILEMLAGVTSAINYLTLANAAVNNGPELQAAGGDDNIGVEVVPKGTAPLVVRGANAWLQVDAAAPATPNPKGLYEDSMIKMWVYWDYNAGTPEIQDDVNVSSLSDTGTGNATVNFASNMLNANYSAWCVPAESGDFTSCAFSAGTSSVDGIVRTPGAGGVDTKTYMGVVGNGT